jgi:hypothetical protein
MSGSNTTNQNGVYGVMGIPDSNNIPSGRYGAVSWIDNSENMWLLGGNGYHASGSQGNAIQSMCITGEPCVFNKEKNSNHSGALNVEVRWKLLDLDVWQ